MNNNNNIDWSNIIIYKMNNNNIDWSNIIIYKMNNNNNIDLSYIIIKNE